MCLYPLIGGVFAGRRQREILATYDENIKKEEESEFILHNARRYNQILGQAKEVCEDAETGVLLGEMGYERQLDPTGNGIMGIIQIPRIQVHLPIWHGTEKETLLNGVGHWKESSLPVGGEGTRCVLTGHRGLPNSRMFTRLDELEIGDILLLTVCGETLAYRVYGTEVVEPEDIERLKQQPGRDLLSLVTCTPYGINTHRLIVNGERIPYNESIPAEIQPDLLSGREQGYLLLLAAFMLMIVIGGFRKKRRRGVRTHEKIKYDRFRCCDVYTRYGASGTDRRGERGKHLHGIGERRSRYIGRRCRIFL